MIVIEDYDFLLLLPEIHAACVELEVFLGDVDEIETSDGVICADAAVDAFNKIVAALRNLKQGAA